MLEGLHGLAERPWGTWTKQGKPMTQRHLAELLKLFGIKSGTIRIGEATPKGYTLADFADSFVRYLSDSPSATTPHANIDAELAGNVHPPHIGDVADAKSTLSADDNGDLADVADRNLESPAMTIVYEL